MIVAPLHAARDVILVEVRERLKLLGKETSEGRIVLRTNLRLAHLDGVANDAGNLIVGEQLVMIAGQTRGLRVGRGRGGDVGRGGDGSVVQRAWPSQRRCDRLLLVAAGDLDHFVCKKGAQQGQADTAAEM